MFINIKTLGKTLVVNKEAITVARPARLNRAEGFVEYVPLISVLPGKEMEIELEGQPFLNENDCLNALRTLLGLETTETTFLVKFFVDGVKTDEQEVAKGATLTGVTDPTGDDGEAFVGWTLNNVPFDLDTPIESNLILFAEFEPIVEHEVTFVWGHGIDDETDFVIDGTIIGAPEAQTVEGYDFLGWFNEGVEFNFTAPITESLVLVADWELNEYTITFNSNGGSLIDEQLVEYEGTVTKPNDPTRTGHAFIEWQLDGIAFDFDTPITENIELLANWEINIYTITFDSNEGSIVDPIIQDFDTPINKPNDPSLEGYTFNGWFVDEALTEEYTFTTMPANNLTLYANWDINEYTITFNSNGGNEQADLALNFNDEITLPTPVREDHTFVGWLLEGSLFELTNMPANNLELVADWEEIPEPTEPDI